MTLTAGANGDPHIKTLDGLGYNFNGLGEFFFMLSKNASFESQMRFEQAKNSDGKDEMIFLRFPCVTNCMLSHSQKWLTSCVPGEQNMLFPVKCMTPTYSV